jgi:hypothetical protein
LLGEPKGQIGGDLPTPNQAMGSLNQLKTTLIERGEATELFARLREDGLAALLNLTLRDRHSFTLVPIMIQVSR